MSSKIRTDQLGRSYPYEPYEAPPIATEELGLSGDAATAIAEASRALGSVPAMPLAGVAAALYRSESSASSIIEGISAGPRRVLEAEFAGAGEIKDEIGSRIVKNLEGLRDAVATAWPARSADFLRWHQLLTAGHPQMRPQHIGAYRTEQNWIGGDTSGPRLASFIPPDPGEVESLISDLERFCARTDVSPLLQALVAHGRFEVIHPFVDGNGRVGRMLLQHLLVNRLELESPIPISLPWSRDPDRYVNGLRAYQDGDLDTWIEFASISVVEAIEWLNAASSDISTLLDEMRSRAATRAHSAASKIITDLATYPLVEAQRVADRYGISLQAAHRSLGRLEERGILIRRSFARRAKTEGRPRQVYTAPELISLIERLTTT